MCIEAKQNKECAHGKMKAAVWHGPGNNNFRIEHIPIPLISDYEVLIEVKRCFFCAMHARAILVGHAKHSPPVVFGRMLAGDVVKVGKEVKSVKVGERVTINPEKPCGHCYYCKKNMTSHCLHPVTLPTGGMAEFISVPAKLVDFVYPIPQHISYENAAFTETLACVVQGVEMAGIKKGDTVVVLGDGAVGLSFVQLVKKEGAAKIIISGKNQKSLKKSKLLGATNAVNIKTHSLKDTVFKETEDFGADVVIEAVGSSKTYEEAISLVRCGGTAIGFGGNKPKETFVGDSNAIHYRSLKIIGSYRYKTEHFNKAFKLIAKDEIDLKPIITHHLPLLEVEQQVVNLFSNKECKALVIDIN